MMVCDELQRCSYLGYDGGDPIQLAHVLKQQI